MVGCEDCPNFKEEDKDGKKIKTCQCPDKKDARCFCKPSQERGVVVEDPPKIYEHGQTVVFGEDDLGEIHPLDIEIVIVDDWGTRTNFYDEEDAKKLIKDLKLRLKQIKAYKKRKAEQEQSKAKGTEQIPEKKGKKAKKKKE